MKKTLRRILVLAMMIATMFTTVIPAQAASTASFTNLRSSNVTTNSARVDFNISNPSRKEITQAGIEIKESTTSKWTVKTDYVPNAYKYYSSLPCWYIIGAGKEVNLALKPGTTYQYRAFGVVGGIKYYSGTKTFTTGGKAQTPVKPATKKTQNPYYSNIRFSTLTHNNARIDFNITNPSRLTITIAGIQVRKAGSGVYKTKMDIVSSSYRNRSSIPCWYTIGSGKEVNMKLQPNTKYEYRLFYVMGGRYLVTNTLSFTTKNSPSTSTTRITQSTSGRNILGNGTGGINININAAPYTSKNNGTAYSTVGCAWFAACRGQQLTGKNLPIFAGSQWYNSYYSSYGFSRGRTLRGKAFACYNNHILVIEKVVGNDVYISEGGCNGWGANYNTGYCRIAKVTKSFIENEMTRYSGSFLGYVYL